MGTWPDKHYDKSSSSPAVKKFNIGLAKIDKGLTVFGELDKNRVPTLVTVVVAERADLEMRYDWLLLYELGMHMLMMGPNLEKQLMDAKNQLVQTAEELPVRFNPMHGATMQKWPFLPWSECQ